ncbi:GNAT family N-acetyltransferase [Actinotalea subterranea]|uniref:GNAT family N-acetyltransferase n=1 Tax=Actinotalea subterranea TaxID=2607497 RepID=UPI0011EFF82B|nr:GNAT family N-acetyltransferase [Actinotalea subterranea]
MDQDQRGAAQPGDQPGTDDVTVRYDAGRERYEVVTGGETAGFAQVREADGRMTFFHTEVDGAYEGQGLGTTLVRGALKDATGRGLRVVPLCPFVAAYLRRHHEFDAHVDWPEA